MTDVNIFIQKGDFIMFTWLKKLTEKEETFVCWFFYCKHEDDAIKFEVKAKRHDVKNIVEVVQSFLNYIGCDGHSNWHYWIDNYCKTVSPCKNKDVYMNFDTVKESNKKFYEFMKAEKDL